MLELNIMAARWIKTASCSMIALFIAAGPTEPALAQQAYPNKPIRVIIGYPAGGSGDVLIRRIGDAVRPILGQPLVLENKSGASTNIAAEYVARSAPDGYTLLVGGDASHGINPSLYGKLSFDPQKDFVPITKLVSLPMVIAAHPSLGVNSLADLVKKAKTTPEGIAFASTGNGGPAHLIGVMIGRAGGVKLAHIPYRGGSLATVAVLGGEPKLLIVSATTAMPHVRDGKLRALSVASAKRSPVVPDVPGAAESGLSGLDLSAYLGLWAPAGTPLEIVQKLSAAFNTALNDPSVRQDLLKTGLAPEPSAHPSDFDAFIRSDAAVWARLVKESGATVD